MSYKTKHVRAKNWKSARKKAMERTPKSDTVVSVLKLSDVPKVRGMYSYQVVSRRKK
jgi:hypothetical protein